MALCMAMSESCLSSRGEIAFNCISFRRARTLTIDCLPIVGELNELAVAAWEEISDDAAVCIARREEEGQSGNEKAMWMWVVASTMMASACSRIPAIATGYEGGIVHRARVGELAEKGDEAMQEGPRERRVEGLLLRRVRGDACMAETERDHGGGKRMRAALGVLARAAVRFLCAGGVDGFSHVMEEVMIVGGECAQRGGCEREMLAVLACKSGLYVPGVMRMVGEGSLERVRLADEIVDAWGRKSGGRERDGVHAAMRWYGRHCEGWIRVLAKEREREGGGRWRTDAEWAAELVLGGASDMIVGDGDRGPYLFDRLSEWRWMVKEGNEGEVRVGQVCERLVASLLGGEVVEGWVRSGLGMLCEELESKTRGVPRGLCGRGGKRKRKEKEGEEEMMGKEGGIGRDDGGMGRGGEKVQRRADMACGSEAQCLPVTRVGVRAPQDALVGRMAMVRALSTHGTGASTDLVQYLSRLRDGSALDEAMMQVLSEDPISGAAAEVGLGKKRAWGEEGKEMAARLSWLMSMMNGSGEAEMRIVCQKIGWPEKAAQLAATLELLGRGVS